MSLLLLFQPASGVAAPQRWVGMVPAGLVFGNTYVSSGNLLLPAEARCDDYSGNWAAAGPGTVSNDAATSVDGWGSVKFDTPVGAGDGFRNVSWVAASPATVYSFSAQMKNGTGALNVPMTIESYNASFGSVGQNSVTKVTSTSWARYTCDALATTPANTAWLRVTFSVATASRSLWVDEVKLEQAATCTTY